MWFGESEANVREIFDKASGQQRKRAAAAAQGRGVSRRRQLCHTGCIFSTDQALAQLCTPSLLCPSRLL